MKEKNGKDKNIVIVILSVLLLISVLYISYDKILNKESKYDSSANNMTDNNTVEDRNKISTQEIEQSKNDSKSNFFENMKSNRKLTRDEQFGVVKMVLDKYGDVYCSIYEDYTIDSHSVDIGEKKEYKIDGYIYSPGDNAFNGYKLDIHNVISMYHSYKGNSAIEAFIFIKDNGTIGELTYFLDRTIDGKEQIIIQDFKETVPGYSNIISVVHSDSFGSAGYRLIDINGNVFDVQ